MNVLTVNDISKRYGKQQALDHVSFTLDPGHIYGFVGNNGAGKTTLFRILAGLVTPNSGSITLLGASTPKELRTARRKVGFLLPRESFSEDLTALQNLMAFQRLRGYHDENEAMTLLTKVGLDEDHARCWKLQSLSTGEFQRVAIAAVQLGNPQLLVLDEPQNGLDPAAVHEFRQHILAMHQEGMTMILSSHILSELYMLATDYIFIHHGKILRTMRKSALDEQRGDKSLEDFFLSMVGGEGA